MKKIMLGLLTIFLTTVFLAACKSSAPPPSPTSEEGKATAVTPTKETPTKPPTAKEPPAPAQGGPAKEVKPVTPVKIDKPVDALTPEDMEKLTAVIETNQGVIKFKFFPKEAPNTCKNFIKLAQAHFYDGLIFHRVIAGFMIQGGDPKGDGSSGPGYSIKAEFNSHNHVPGTVSMARSSDPDSAGSQFFICLEAKSHLDGQYTAFGQVSSGLEVVQKIGATKTSPTDRPIEPQTMKKVYIEGL